MPCGRSSFPKIIEAKANLPLRTMRIWSAGCSTGEEPYTLNMLLLEEGQSRLKDWSIEILATDLNERSLAHARNAIYGSYSTRNLTPYYRQKYFTPAGEQLQVQPAARNSINFSRLNLSDDGRMTFMKGLDVVFCCNVLIYFDLASKRRVIQHFYNNLLPHGYLFLGHSESLYGVSDDFRLVHLPGATAYIKGERHRRESRNSEYGSHQSDLTRSHRRAPAYSDHSGGSGAIASLSGAADRADSTCRKSRT